MSENLKCWNCGKGQEKLMKCAGCRYAVYCNKDCQRAHWSNHKEACKMEAKLRAAGQMQRENPDMIVGSITGGVNEQRFTIGDGTGKDLLTVLKDVRKWSLIHRSLIDFAIVQALQVEIHPERVHTHFLDIDVAYNTDPKAPKVQMFTFLSCSVQPFHPDYWTNPINSALAADRNSVMRNGGVGVSVFRVRVRDSVIPGHTEGGRVESPVEERFLLTNWEEIFKLCLDGKRDMSMLLPAVLLKRKLQAQDPSGDKYAVATLKAGRVLGDLRSKKDPGYRGTLPRIK
ncbi:hypothetical protein JAAARDRAFT_34494 [Jaapia argillacea MUCL 33604]|uniref:MYND-type domain-containing protein n=1 Tax=Jaapia argillacea MUCL 33604 TaxID=933084 RepID=A0A067PXP5_9AGAM|nr:hypothetical protein JAAARDRAFT_34494 [Jaapia argillacea MUCL 33604]